MTWSDADREAWESQHHAQMRANNPDYDKPKADPDARIRKELQYNDPTLPAIIGNNNLSQGRFEFLGEHQGHR